MRDCPCGTGFPYIDCCGPLIRGASPADTAEDLMRSRYSAFAMGEWDFIDKTLHPDEREGRKEKLTKRADVVWTGLEILEIRGGDIYDTEGEIAFAAHFRESGEAKILKEQSIFIRKDGKWFYSQRRSRILPLKNKVSSPKTPQQPIKRDRPKVGRNDPCYCGSLKKFKKCCGSG